MGTKHIVAGLAAGFALIPAIAGLAAPLPGGLGPCVPGNCGPYPYPPHNGSSTLRDNAINVYAGGDYQVRESAAEAEGRIVVLGDFDQNKAAASGGAYNVGIVGVGSQARPEAGTDFLTVGGNITVAPTQRVIAEGGKVRHGGTVTGTVNVLVPADLIQDPNATAPYTSLLTELEEASQCYADEALVPETGSIVYASPMDPFGVIFSGDGTSMLQVFYVDRDLVALNGTGQVDLRFVGVPAGATVLINVTKPDWHANISGNFDGTWDALREKTLWNIPSATTPRFGGTAQFQGSVLIGDPTSTTTVTNAGMNGRFFTAGSIVHGGTGGASGNEFHSYPFTGDLPSCGNVVPTPSASPTGSPAVTASPSEETPSPAPLPTTGSRVVPLMGLGFGLVVAGVLLLFGSLRRLRYNS